MKDDLQIILDKIQSIQEILMPVELLRCLNRAESAIQDAMQIEAAYRHKLGAEKASQISGDNIQTVIKYYADRNRCGFEGIDVSKLI